MGKRSAPVFRGRAARWYGRRACPRHRRLQRHHSNLPARLYPAGRGLEQIPLGASQEQVLVVLGTPSTVATVSGEVFYYISQKTEQTSFMPQQETNRRIVAVYFDRNRKVERLADYGIKDGKVFDYITRTTPSGGEELSYLSYMFRIFRWS